jgi:hypothetical protein
LKADLRDFAIRDLGCTACALYGVYPLPVDKHHLNAHDQPGGKRRGEAYTVGLCRWHHTGHCFTTGAITDCPECMTRLGPSWRHHKRAFINRFGDGDALLTEQNKRLDAWRKSTVGVSE